MVNSAELQIKSTLVSGSVYLFKEDQFKDCDHQHYFIVLNQNPLSDRLLCLVWAKTLSESVFLRIDNSDLPSQTFVDITTKCEWVSHPTIIDCNQIIEKDINEIIDKLENKKLKIIGEVDKTILGKLIEGALASPLVERRIKKLLK
jgi:hypothetical protein